MDERTGEIRQEIEETRMRVGDEVDALSYKTDVGARLGDYVEEKKEAVTSKVTGVVPSKEGVQRRARRVGTIAKENPLGFAVGAAAVGFVAGLLVPSTRVEDERLGEVADRVRETASEAGQAAVERGKDVARSAMETAREEGAEQGRELAGELKDRVQQEAQQSEPAAR
jgi:gas vesicle protein